MKIPASLVLDAALTNPNLKQPYYNEFGDTIVIARYTPPGMGPGGAKAAKKWKDNKELFAGRAEGKKVKDVSLVAFADGTRRWMPSQAAKVAVAAGTGKVVKTRGSKPKKRKKL